MPCGSLIQPAAAVKCRRGRVVSAPVGTGLLTGGLRRAGLETLLGVPAVHLLGERRVLLIAWTGRGEDHHVAVGIYRRQVPGVPRGVGGAIDTAAAVAASLRGQCVEFVVD